MSKKNEELSPVLIKMNPGEQDVNQDDPGSLNCSDLETEGISEKIDSPIKNYDGKFPHFNNLSLIRNIDDSPPKCTPARGDKDESIGVEAFDEGMGIS